MSFSATKDDFTIIKNGIDPSLEIIRHDESGYYQVTKDENLIIDWMQLDSTIELIKECRAYSSLEDVIYGLRRRVRTPKQYIGFYMHKYLYDHFMSWLDSKYAIKVGNLLDSIHQEANSTKQ